MDPPQLLQSLVDHGWDWKIDYTLATPEEVFLWGRADLVIRSIRALRQGRTVTFNGETFQGFSMDIAGRLEDAMADSGRMIALLRDDGQGVVIGALWPECEQ